MSFILDALKKSENARQRQVGPSFADVPVSRHATDKPWWAFAVAALLVVNLGVLLVVLTRSGSAGSATTEPRQNAAPAAQGTQQQHDTGTQVPLPATQSRIPRGERAPAATSSARAVRPLADEAALYGSSAPPEADPILAAAAAAPPEGPPMVRRVDAPSVAPLPNPPAFQSRATQNEEVLPTANELAAGGTSLPEMHLDIHVYSANAAERFVFVNMRKYIEGQTLSEGPALERITSEGAVLNHRGLRFLLPRQ